jgi:chromosome segregation ATPase
MLLAWPIVDSLEPADGPWTSGEYAMPPQRLESRVEALERRVTHLEDLPERVTRVESQVLQLRTEMRDEFSAVRSGLANLSGEVDEVRTGLANLSGEVDEVRTGLANLSGQIAELRTQVHAGDEETRRFMRVLYEDLVSRIATIGKG